MGGGANGQRATCHGRVANSSPAPVEQSENKEPSDVDVEDSDNVGSEEVMNLQPTQSEADHSLLREEVENIINSTSPDDINLEK
eukprot:553128-Ditylum_brightwellii.AAC.1